LLLDDSVRFLGKEIDPYSTQHKRDANYYREVLLEYFMMSDIKKETEEEKEESIKSKMN
jgi:hypothetical protein